MGDMTIELLKVAKEMRHPLYEDLRELYLQRKNESLEDKIARARENYQDDD